MSGIELKPISESGGTNILLPLGKTNLGRGSFFGIADKRVSRNHAVLEVEDGKVKLMPIHTNPTFFRGEGGTKLSPLTRDEWRELKNGDRIALTPDEHIFEVIIDERPIVQETLSPRCSLGDGSPMKQATPNRQATALKPHQNNGVHDGQKENRQKSEAEAEDLDKEKEESMEQEEPDTEAKERKEDGEEKEEEEEKQDTYSSIQNKGKGQSPKGKSVRGRGRPKKYTHTSEEDESEEEVYVPRPTKQRASSSPNSQPGDEASIVLDGDKEVAVPVQRERTLPAWMTSAPKQKAESGSAKNAKREMPAKKAPKQKEETETSQKRGRGRPKVGTKSASQTKSTPSKAKSRARSYVDDDDDDDYISEEEPAPKRSKSSRSQRGSTKVKSYAEDDYDELDEEWVASDVDDGGSDWEMDSQSYSSKKGKGKGRSPKGKAIRSRGRSRGRPKKYTHTSEEEDDWSEEEAYVPRPTKRRASSSSNSQPAEKVKRSSRKTVIESDVSEDEVEEEPQRNKRTNVQPNKGSDKKELDVSGDEEKEEEEEKSAQKKEGGKKKLKPCPFGKRCYRKNPDHFKDFCHPGDPDYNSHSDDDDQDDDRSECEFGTSCYRENAEHKKQYKHTKSPERPQREAARKDKKKGALAGESDDEDAPNTYDYNDSFLNDEEGSASPDDKAASDDSDWGPEPEDSQDIRDLKKEAKDFIKNKKMQKT